LIRKKFKPKLIESKFPVQVPDPYAQTDSIETPISKPAPFPENPREFRIQGYQA
jgi:hypothetical protein